MYHITQTMFFVQLIVKNNVIISFFQTFSLHKISLKLVFVFQYVIVSKDI